MGDVILPSGIRATSRIKDIMAADVIILAVPSHAFAGALLQLNQVGLPENTILLVATKGLCENPVQFFSSRIESEFDNSYAFGLDIETGGHVFQLLFTNSQSSNEPGFMSSAEGDMVFGFNVVRVF